MTLETPDRHRETTFLRSFELVSRLLLLPFLIVNIKPTNPPPDGPSKTLPYKLTYLDCPLTACFPLSPLSDCSVATTLLLIPHQIPHGRHF